MSADGPYGWTHLINNNIVTMEHSNNPIDDFDLNFSDLEFEIADICDKSEIKEMITLQLQEVEMLQSMFPNPGEFKIDNYGITADMYQFVEDKTTKIPAQLDYQILLNIDSQKFEVSVNYPHEYPACEPDIYTRCEKLTRFQQNQLNTDLSNYVDTLDRGELCACSAIFWIQENALKYLDSKETEPAPSPTPRSNTNATEFGRYWIYSHHIYSKMKRREMLQLSSDYAVTGFMLPGRPGLICIEGAAQDCADWWFKVKSMPWKKIICRKQENVPTGGVAIDKLRKFVGFKEVAFQSQNLTSKHMNMGDLYKFLDQHGCAYAFKEYFGVDGKIGQ